MEKEIGLLRSQRNEVFRILQARNLPPTAFEWVEEPASAISVWPSTQVLRHKDLDLYLRLKGLRERDGEPYFSAEVWPGKTAAPELVTEATWSKLLGPIGSWADRVKGELAEPDLWTLASTHLRQANLPQLREMGNEPFSYDEALGVTRRLQELSERIASREDIDNSLKDDISSKLDYLADASKRQGRLDWYHTAIGVFATIATSLAVADLDVESFWQVVKNTVGRASVFLLGS